MKPIRAVALLVALGGTVAGWAAGTKTDSTQRTVTVRRHATFGPIMVMGTRTRTIANVTTGTDIRCKGGTAANVPRRGVGVSESTGLSGGAVGSATDALSPGEISIMHRGDGSIRVTCKP